MLRVPNRLDRARAAPLLCAGITAYSPLRKYRAGKGTRLGVAGLGGLGHMAVKLGVALGCEVTVVTGSASKRADALALARTACSCHRTRIPSPPPHRVST